jgi:ribonuclease HI
VDLVIYIDGGARGNPGLAGAGVVIRSSDGRLVHEGGYFLGEQTNNMAEYRALILALQRAARCGQQMLQVCSDSELLVRQVTGEYRIKSPNLVALYQQVERLLLKVPRWRLTHIRRAENTRADELANLAMDRRRTVIVYDADGADDANAAGGDLSALAPPADATNAPGALQGATDNIGAAASVAEVAGAPADATLAAGAGHGPPRAVRVTLAQAPLAGQCPAGDCAPAAFTVAGKLPAALCLHAAHALVPTILAILNTEPQEFAAVPTMTVRCSKRDCAAVFHLSPILSSNGGAKSPS